MKKFNDIEMKPHPWQSDGVIGQMYFKNGYGVSVVRHEYSYGGTAGLYELAILNSDGDIVYDTHITTDVIGHLTGDDVTDIMYKVQKLKKWKVKLNNFIKRILNK